MSALFSMTVPGKPVPKGRPKFARVGSFTRAYTPETTRRYEDIVAWEARQIWKEGPLTTQLRVHVIAYLPIPQRFSKAKEMAAINGSLKPTTRPDADNYAKSAIDALNGIVFRDDSLITDLIVAKRYDDRPRLEIIVEAA